MKHTDREYEAELQKVSNLVSHMAGQVESMIALSAQALRDRDRSLAKQVIESDRRINESEREIDSLVLRVVALRQPVAGDLRLVTTVSKLVTDLERVGDLAKNVCERVLELVDLPRQLEDSELLAMAGKAESMIRGAMQAFMTRDELAARAIIAQDDEVDEVFHRVISTIAKQMTEDTRMVPEALRLQAIAKYIERIGDHATNLAEMVVFVAKGEDIRHSRGARTVDKSH